MKISIDRLQAESEISLREDLPATLFAIEEEELKFEGEVSVQGKTYLAGDELILNFSASVEALLPCRICNQMTKVLVSVDNLYHAEPVSEIKGGVFCDEGLIREALLLELPAVVECHKGKCPEREHVARYFRDA